MVRHKNSLVLFGGFYDTGYEVHVPRSPQALWSRAALQVNYFNDLHIFDLDKQVSGLVFLPPHSGSLFVVAQEWRKVGDDPRGDNR